MHPEHKPSKARLDKFRRLAHDVVTHHLGGAPTRLEFQTSGLSNFVFAVRHAEGRFFIRISPEPDRLSSYIKEQWAQTAAAKVGVPAGRILEVGASAIPHPYMITAEAAGEEATYHPERGKILEQLGEYAAAINSIRTHGFGETFDWSNNELSYRKSFREYLEKEFLYEDRLEVLRKFKMCSGAKLKNLAKVMRDLSRSRPTPHLNHSDLRLKNVLVDNSGKITAILDWEHAMSTIAPQWELSIALHDLSVDEMQHLLAGYGMSRRRLSGMAEQMKAFNILNYSGHVEQAAAARDKVTLERFRTRLSGTLDMYSL